MAELHTVRAQALAGPGEKATRAQHAKGKLTARERIGLLLDPGTFHEVEQPRRRRATGFGLEANKPYTDGVVTGWGTVEDRTVFVYAHDFRVFGGALGEAHATKIHKIMDMAVAAGAPWCPSTTARAPASRRASAPSPATAASSGATPGPPASSQHADLPSRKHGNPPQ